MSDIYKDNAIQTRAIYPTSGFSQYIALLVISKLLHSFGLFIAYDLLKLLHVVQLLFFIKVGSAICFVLLQKPFSNTRKITKQQWVRIWRHAFFNSLINLLWLFGLTLCGPLRTILLSDHADLVVIAGASALFTSNGGTAKVRGAVFFLICVVALLLFDNDNPLIKHLEHPEGFEQQHHGVSHVFYYFISWIGVADHKGGVILLFIVLCLRTGFNSAARKLSVDLGGAKRLNAASTLISAIMLAPWVLAVMYIQVNNVESWFMLFIPITLVTVFGFVFDYYVEAICTARLDANKTANYGSIAVVLSAFLFSIFWNHPYAKQMKNAGYIFLEDNEDHVLSGGVIFSGVMVVFATSILSSPSTKGTKGSFIGYSSSGQPLYNFSGDALQRTSQSLLLLSKNGLKQILEEPDSRKIFYFLCANLSFTFVELIYGVWTNSLGLISDGFHMLFDCSALVMGLFAALMTRWKATRIFSYGYGRVEVLSGFLNGLFLVVIAFFVFTEALSRLLDPPQIITERLLTVSLAGLLVNLMGILAFRHAHSHSGQVHHHGSAHSHHGHSHAPSHHDGHGHHHEHGSASNANMRGVFLHILADTLGSVGVIVSSLLIENFGWLIADPICSLFIAILIFISVLPLLKESALVLLQRTPVGMEQELGEALQKVLTLEGVLSFQDQHFWQHSTHIIAGTIHVQVMPDASEQKIIAQMTAIFKDCGVDNFTVQVEKEAYFQHMSALSSNFSQMVEVTPIITKGNFLSTANFAAAV